MFVLSPALRDILHTPMARYSLFVLKVPLNTMQTNKLHKDQVEKFVVLLVL